ncbi:FAD-dependent monooxygenase [Phanerochaete sordida]|uniref:FAD-dependent monooxygenase n=1 Tax=Phanerochaete sordida TaxID=48140 RepID=A0A9P3GHQ7_9APHY|nr:FAD-dependent monooxygenase [Phanerochaete sordida]
MPPARVGVIGAGIAGPVLAMFLKQKGYHPVLYERLAAPSDAGLGIGLQQNGTAVLAKLPGLLEAIGGHPTDEFRFYSVLPGDTGLLGRTEHLRALREHGQLAMSVRRPLLHARVVAHAQQLGAEVRFGHKLEGLAQSEEGVEVVFANGAKETFDFVVGCDGLHSSTRVCLFGDMPADYTGLTHCGGISPTPASWAGRHAGHDFYGDGAYMLAVTMADAQTAWAINQREPEAKEDWKAIDAAAAEHFKQHSPFSDAPFGAGEIVRSSLKIVKYGIYDRPELKTWHQGRVVLIGDAAHPTSPHLGQGANQAYEDVDLLVELLEKHSPAAEPPSTATLQTVFAELERVRLPRTAEIVRQARAQGDMRVVAGVEAGMRRNNAVREMCADPAKLTERFGVV